MPTFTALTTLMGEQPAQRLGEALESLAPAPTGVGVFEVEDGSGLWEVGGYFLEGPDDIALALLAAAHGAKDFVVSELPDQDWVAHVRRELAPVEAGRFFVYGSHDADQVPTNKVSLSPRKAVYWRWKTTFLRAVFRRAAPISAVVRLFWLWPPLPFGARMLSQVI